MDTKDPLKIWLVERMKLWNFTGKKLKTPTEIKMKIGGKESKLISIKIKDTLHSNWLH